MNQLLGEVIEAHGGLRRWNEFRTIEATVRSGGEFFTGKGLPIDPAVRKMTVATREQKASVTPFGKAEQKTLFQAGLIAIQGESLSEHRSAASECSF